VVAIAVAMMVARQLKHDVAGDHPVETELELVHALLHGRAESAEMRDAAKREL
jgi:hypothetical protein